MADLGTPPYRVCLVSQSAKGGKPTVQATAYSLASAKQTAQLTKARNPRKSFQVLDANDTVMLEL